MGMAQLVVTAVLVEGRSKSRGGPRLRGLPPLGDHPGAAVPRRRRGRAAAALPPPAPQPRPHRPGRRGRDRRAAQRPRPARPRGRRRDHRRPPRTTPRPRRGAGGVDDLADPVRPRIRHPATAQTPEMQLQAVLRRRPERALATRHHPLPPRRPHRGRDPQHHRRPLPALRGLHRPADLHRRRRRHRLHRRHQHLRRPREPAVGQRGRVHRRPAPRRPRRPRGHLPHPRHPLRPLPAPTTRRPAGKSNASTKP